MDEVTKDNLIYMFWMAVFLISGVSVGWFGNDVYRDIVNKRTLDGLWIRGGDYETALETAYDRDNIGEWVCVNIAGMEMKRALETCNHEVGHEIFAEKCEKNIEKCMEVIDSE